MASISGERPTYHSRVATMKMASVSIFATAQAGTYSISSFSCFTDTELSLQPIQRHATNRYLKLNE